MGNAKTPASGTSHAPGPRRGGIVMTVPVTYVAVSLNTQVIPVNAIKGRLGRL